LKVKLPPASERASRLSGCVRSSCVPSPSKLLSFPGVTRADVSAGAVPDHRGVPGYARRETEDAPLCLLPHDTHGPTKIPKATKYRGEGSGTALTGAVVNSIE
jgi:hypothetical protein